MIEQQKTPCYVCGFRMALPASQVQHPCVPCGGKHALCADHLYEFNPSIIHGRLRVCPTPARIMTKVEGKFVVIHSINCPGMVTAVMEEQGVGPAGECNCGAEAD